MGRSADGTPASGESAPPGWPPAIVACCVSASCGHRSGRVPNRARSATTGRERVRRRPRSARRTSPSLFFFRSSRSGGWRNGAMSSKIVGFTNAESAERVEHATRVAGFETVLPAKSLESGRPASPGPGDLAELHVRACGRESSAAIDRARQGSTDRCCCRSPNRGAAGSARPAAAARPSCPRSS